MKYLLIDSNNLAIRCAFSNESLTNKNGEPSSVHYGFFNTLLSLRQSYPEHQILCVWDGKSKRRMMESEAAVKTGLIKSAYKANRKKDEQPKAVLDFYLQAPFLKRAIGQTGIPQICLEDYETDDIIAAYCKKLKKDNQIVCLTSDHDYYQLLDDNVAIYDGMKQKLITKAEWEKTNGIECHQHVHIGSLMGDNGDNIFGVYGVGEKTALEMIKEYGTWQNTMKALHVKLDPLRVQYPDVTGDEFKRLAELKTEKGKIKYPDINADTPFTGVALAFEDKKIKKLAKTDLMTLMFERRVELAYSLKKMDADIPDLPEIKQASPNITKLMEYFDYYDIASLKDSVDLLK